MTDDKAFKDAVVLAFCNVQVMASGLLRTVPFSPTATNRWLVVLSTTLVNAPTAFNVLVLLDACAVQVVPSVLVRMVPLAPTATHVPAAVYATPCKFAAVGTLLAAVHVMASLLFSTVPLSPTATTMLPLAARAFKFCEVLLLAVVQVFVSVL